MYVILLTVQLINIHLIIPVLGKSPDSSDKVRNSNLVDLTDEIDIK